MFCDKTATVAAVLLKFPPMDATCVDRFVRFPDNPEIVETVPVRFPPMEASCEARSVTFPESASTSALDLDSKAYGTGIVHALGGTVSFVVLSVTFLLFANVAEPLIVATTGDVTTYSTAL